MMQRPLQDRKIRLVRTQRAFHIDNLNDIALLLIDHHRFRADIRHRRLNRIRCTPLRLVFAIDIRHTIGAIFDESVSQLHIPCSRDILRLKERRHFISGVQMIPAHDQIRRNRDQHQHDNGKVNNTRASSIR